MGNRYPSQSQTGYNTNPPSDTPGDTSASNQVEWAKHKQKLGDPILTLSNSINAALLAQFDQGPVPVSVNTTTDASNYNQVIEAINTITISLMTAVTAGKGYIVTLKNAGTGVVTYDLATGTDNIDGVVNGTGTLASSQSLTFIVNDAEDGYFVLGIVQEKGSFTGTFNGLIGSNTATVTWVKRSGIVNLMLPGVGGVSNSTAFSMTGLPSAVTPAGNQYVSLPNIVDNGVALAPGTAWVSAAGSIQFYPTSAGSSWTISGAKSLGENTITYSVS